MAMMVEGGLPALLGLFCEVDAGVLALTYATLLLHELTAIVDVAYADGRRVVTPTEQHVHGFLERVPLMATAFLTVLHWDQARAAVGAGGRPDWRIRTKRQPLSRRYRVGVLAAVPLLGALPYDPPGIPAVAPGELYTEENISYLEAFVEAGGFVEGASDPSLQKLRVVAE